MNSKNLTAETKYNIHHEPIMTTLYAYNKDIPSQKIVIIAVKGWKNKDDMIKIAKEARKL